MPSRSRASDQRARRAVPQREGEHADGALDRGLDAPERAGFQQHLGIGIAAHRPAGGCKLAADVAVIVDLAVEGDDVAPVGRMHRLRAAGTEIDDREPALRQHRAAFGLDPDPAAVGTAVAQRLVHGFADRAQRVSRGRRAPVDHAGNAAHSLTPGFRSRLPAAGELVPKLLALVEADGRRVTPRARSSHFRLRSLPYPPPQPGLDIGP